MMDLIVILQLRGYNVRIKYFEITMVIETNHIENDEQLSNFLDHLKMKGNRINQSAVTDCKEVKEFPGGIYHYND